MSERIFLSPPSVEGEEASMLLEALESNWIAPLGPHVDTFERELADYVGTADAAVLSSGTAAIHLCLIVEGVRANDVVIAPSFTFVASINPILYLGAEPWFVDSIEGSWNMDPDLVERAIESARASGRRVGAVLAVDIVGQCADYDRLERICADAGVPLIEDSAEALGSSFRGRKAGAFGAAGILSFNGNKIITTSGGGAVVSDDVELVARCRHLATQAREPAIHYQHEVVGFNYRMSNLLAAVGRAQLATLDDRVRKRRATYDTYVSLLGDVVGLTFEPEIDGSRSNRWLTTLSVDPSAFGASNTEIIAALERENIEARLVWKPMHQQPLFAGCRIFGGAVAEAAFDRGICLPSGSQLSIGDIERIAAHVKAVGS